MPSEQTEGKLNRGKKFRRGAFVVRIHVGIGHHGDEEVQKYDSHEADADVEDDSNEAHASARR